MSVKKTVSIVEMVNTANQFMASSDKDYIRDRLAVFNFVETFLHKNKCYSGFSYLESAGVQHWQDNEGKPRVHIEDESRRCINLHPRLR